MGNPNSKGHSAIMDDNFVSVEKYTGETKDSQRHGHGIYMYPNGDIYDGRWRKSRRYGYGVYTFSNGRRVEGYFYKDEYIGEKPNGKIQKRMAKMKNKRDTVDFSMTEQTDLSTDILDDNKNTVFSSRAGSLRRNRWSDKAKDKTETDVSTPLKADTKQGNGHEQQLNNFQKSYSFQDRRKKGIGADEVAESRRRSRVLHESIRQKYNLPVKRI